MLYNNSMSKKSIIVLGAGFGGLRAAMDLAEGVKRLKLMEKYEITLVDKNRCHLYTPLLYKLAAAPDPRQTSCLYDIDSLIKNLPIHFINDEIKSLDIPNGNIQLTNQ